MTNTDKQYYIYLRSTRERVPCTKEEFDNYYRDINAFRKTQQRHGRCVCPEKKRLDCDMDCATCPFRRGGDLVSLDYTTTNDDDSEEIAWIDSIPDDGPLIEELITDSSVFEQLFKRLHELMPEAIEIGQMRLSGKSDLYIATQLGVRNTTFRSRIDRAKKILATEFPELF